MVRFVVKGQNTNGQKYSVYLLQKVMPENSMLNYVSEGIFGSGANFNISSRQGYVILAFAYA